MVKVYLIKLIIIIWSMKLISLNLSRDQFSEHFVDQINVSTCNLQEDHVMLHVFCGGFVETLLQLQTHCGWKQQPANPAWLRRPGHSSVCLYRLYLETFLAFCVRICITFVVTLYHICAFICLTLFSNPSLPLLCDLSHQRTLLLAHPWSRWSGWLWSEPSKAMMSMMLSWNDMMCHHWHRSMRWNSWAVVVDRGSQRVGSGEYCRGQFIRLG